MTALEELTVTFRRLGAPDPEAWARSQLEEGIPQLARFMFLRAAWRLVRSDNNDRWIAEVLSRDPKGVGGAATEAVRRALKGGIAPADLTIITRDAQWSLLFNVCYLLSCGSDVDEDTSNVRWGLYQLDEDDQPTVEIGGLHESVLETDPTGREMRAATSR